MNIKNIEQKINPKTNGFYLFKESFAASQPGWGSTRADYGLEAETNIMPPTEHEFDEGLMLPYKKHIQNGDRVIIVGVPTLNAGYGFNGRSGTIRLVNEPKRYWDDKINSVRVELDDKDKKHPAFEVMSIPIRFLKPYDDKDELDEIYWLKNENKQISKWLKTTTEPYDNFYWDGQDLLVLKEKIVIETINRNILIENKVIPEERKDKKYDYGCLMTYFDIPAWKDVLSMIEPDDIYTEEYEEFGLENEPHATILFGLHDNEINLENIKKELADINEIPIKINGISHFEPENKPYDVVKFDVESDILHQLNQQIKKFPNTNEYNEYDPHMTIAYVKKGTGQKYTNKFLSYPTLIGNRVVYSYPSGKKDVWELPIKTEVINTIDYIQEGLMLAYKKFPDRYFDSNTDIEFPKSEINKHPLWYKRAYDNNGNVIYRTDGNWGKSEYDEDGNLIYYETSLGYWAKWEYDQWGNEIYYENSDGNIEDHREHIQEGLSIPYKDLSTPEKWFKDLLNQMDTYDKSAQHPNSIFFYINGKIYMEYNKEFKMLRYHYDKIYSVLASKFGLKYDQINKLVKGMVEEHYNIGVDTTPVSVSFSLVRWRNIII